MSDRQIRRLSSNDIDRLVQFEAANQPIPWTPGVLNDEVVAENRVYLAILDGDSLFAYGGLMVVGEEAHILNLLVAPDQRRNGLGLLLLVGLIKEAIVIGARHLTLEVRSRNVPAITLYRKCGLAPVGIRPGYYGD
ncbi:MAG TPA: ribosomal protein S18-alanine N-acetyltransferase, partial [Acidimicrobiia bacterium]